MSIITNKDFTDEFSRMWKKILSKAPMAYARYADGEVSLMQGRKIDHASQAHQVDRWDSMDNGITLLGNDLKETLYHTEPEWYYAISCQCCDPTGKEWLLKEIKQPNENITYSNLWINDNYKRFIKQSVEIIEPVYLITNYRGKDGMYPWEIEGFYPIEDNCVNNWKLNKQSIIKDMSSIAKEYNGMLYLISAGPMSELLIHHMWISNPTNRYIDIGSAMDEFVHLRKTRPFMLEGTKYFNQKCNF